VDENIQEWICAIIVLNPDSRYYGGYFKAKMTFPDDYPYSPPGMQFPLNQYPGSPTNTIDAPDFRFLKPLYHPNIYPDGRLCISILHAPSGDERALEMAGELASERWSPVQTTESVLLSVLSLLDDAEVSSPANVEAGVMLRNDPKQFSVMVQKDLEASKKDIPQGYIMPTHEDAFKTTKEDDYMMSWEDSDAEEDFGSDSEIGEDGLYDEDNPSDDQEDEE
jgi:ubiquitin-conjugating enzyme E2 R